MKRFLPLLLASAMMLVAAGAQAQFWAPGNYLTPNWDPATSPMLVDDGTGGDAVAGDGIFTATVVVAAPGAWEFKITDAPDWNNGIWPITGNVWFNTTVANEPVVFTFDTNPHGDGWEPDAMWPNTDHTLGATYTVVGDVGSELGGADWDPAGPLLMHDDGLNGDATAGDGIFTFAGPVSLAGAYQWKVAVDGAWAHQYGTDGPTVNGATQLFTVNNDGDEWIFELDTNTARLRAMENAPVPTEARTWTQIKRDIR